MVHLLEGMVMLRNEAYEELREQFARKRVWAVATDYSSNNFHDRLTHSEAVDLARHESEREPGRNAWVVLVAKHVHGPPL